VTIGVGSVVGARLAGRIGTRIVVVTGLVLFAGSFARMAVASTFISYGWIVVVMVMMGLGLGLTSAPATESILSVLPPAKTGVGSAVNDATREAGGTLGVAVIGSVFLSLYARRIDSSLFAHLPGATHTAPRTSVAAAAQTVARAPAPLQHPLLTGFNTSFMSGLHTASAVAAGVASSVPSAPWPFRASEGWPSAPLPPGWQGRPAPTWTSLPTSARLTSTAAEPNRRCGTPVCEEGRNRALWPRTADLAGQIDEGAGAMAGDGCWLVSVVAMTLMTYRQTGRSRLRPILTWPGGPARRSRTHPVGHTRGQLPPVRCQPLPVLPRGARRTACID
jgi:MFS family permease